MWLTFFLEMYFTVDFGFLGILPRSFNGILGIITAPLVHGTIAHLISNTIPLLFLGTTLYLFYDRVATQVFFHCYFFTYLLVWIFGRPYYHIGASGLVYALAGFLVFIGVFKRNRQTLVISIIVILLYGSMIYGIIPRNSYISWESHLMGFLVGIGSAFGMSKIGKLQY